MSRGTGLPTSECARDTAAPARSASLRVEVADQHQRRVVRNVEGPEEIAHVLDRRRLEILHAADGRVLVGVHGERLVVDDLVQPAVRLVLDPHPALFLDHLALGLEDLLLDPERRHPIRLEPEHQRQVLRRERLPEHRGVFVRVGVALPADARDPRRMAFGLDVLRALEHHVLEQVREAGAARRARSSSRRGTRVRRARSASNGLPERRPAARWPASSSCSSASEAGRQPSRWDRRRAARPTARTRSGQSLPGSGSHGRSIIAERSGGQGWRSAFDLELGDSPLEIRDQPAQLRQLPEHRRRLQPVAVGNGRIARR